MIDTPYACRHGAVNHLPPPAPAAPAFILADRSPEEPESSARSCDDTRKEDVADLYVDEFVGLLLVEILAVPPDKPAYFRAVLVWFHEERFPCGRESPWPQAARLLKSVYSNE